MHDVRELAARLAGELGDNPWGPDFEITDPDGNRLRINQNAELVVRAAGEGVGRQNRSPAHRRH